MPKHPKLLILPQHLPIGNSLNPNLPLNIPIQNPEQERFPHIHHVLAIFPCDLEDQGDYLLVDLVLHWDELGEAD